jgi:hypothetical protein
VQKKEEFVAPVPEVAAPVNTKQKLTTYTLTNVSKIYADEDVIMKGGAIVVVDGVVQCVGKGCQPHGTVFDLHGGVAIPVSGLGLAK